MGGEGLIAALTLIGLGVILIAFRRPIAGLSRFNLMSPPQLKGWGYWEKLIPNEMVAWRLEEMLTFLTGCLLVILGLVGLILVLLGFE